MCGVWFWDHSVVVRVPGSGSSRKGLGEGGVAEDKVHVLRSRGFKV